MREHGWADAAAARDDFLLQWLIGTAHQMLSKGIHSAYVVKCMDDLARKHALPPGRQTSLQSFLANFAALQASADAGGSAPGFGDYSGAGGGSLEPSPAKKSGKDAKKSKR